MSSSVLANESRAFENSSSDCDKFPPWWDHTKSDFTTWAEWRCEPGCTIMLTSSQLLNWQLLDGECQSTELSQRKDTLHSHYLLPAAAAACKTVFIKKKKPKMSCDLSHMTAYYTY